MRRVSAASAAALDDMPMILGHGLRVIDGRKGVLVDRAPVAYIRRSRVASASPGDISRDVQLSAIRKLAGEEAGQLVVLEDWGRSGRGQKRHLRTDFGKLLGMIERDEVSTVFAYNLSRLGRNVRDIRELAELAAKHGTAIRLTDGQNVDGSTATGRMTLDILAAVDEWQAEVQSERAAANMASWKARNPERRPGPSAYGRDPTRPEESVAAVLDAFETEGTFLGAARRLNEEGVATRSGSLWTADSVGLVIKRERPELAPYRPTGAGRSVRSVHVFSGLLTCKCGETLTTMRGRGKGWRYYCRRGLRDRSHPRPYQVAESKLLDWAREQLDTMRRIVLLENLPDASAVRVKLEELDAKRNRILDSYLDGVLTKAERDRRLAEVAADRDRAEVSQAVATRRADGKGTLQLERFIDWSAPAPDVNAALRSIWQEVRLNGGMAPVRAVWHVTDDWGEDGPQ